MLSRQGSQQAKQRLREPNCSPTLSSLDTSNQLMARLTTAPATNAITASPTVTVPHDLSRHRRTGGPAARHLVHRPQLPS